VSVFAKLSSSILVKYCIDLHEDIAVHRDGLFGTCILFSVHYIQVLHVQQTAVLK